MIKNASHSMLPSSSKVTSFLLFAAALAIACDAAESSDLDGTGGSTSATGGSTTTGSGGSGTTTGGSTNTGTGGAPGPTGFGTPAQAGSGSSMDRYAKAFTNRDGANYFFMANGWGPGFQSQSVSWSGSAFTVVNMQGVQGPQYEPASYPTVFCGQYSDSKSGPCGLPNALTSISSLRTGWRWQANGNTGQYNAAYDVWLSTTDSITGHSSYLMVWLRDPPGQQPAGSLRQANLTVANVPGVWNLWAGNVGARPCVSYVRAEGQDSPELEFDVMDFVRDAPTRSIALPGSHILSVAVGFEIWNGPVSNLVSQDFYVTAR